MMALVGKILKIGREKIGLYSMCNTVNDRLSPRGLICQNDFLGSIFKV